MICYFDARAYPIRCSLSYNEKEIDTSKWVIRYTTANHFIEQEAAFCDITAENINSKSLIDIDNIHKTINCLNLVYTIGIL